jgi:hypothetical protein
LDLSNIFLAILPNPPPTPGDPAALGGLVQGGLDFLSLWIGRIGGIIAFIGAVKFALSIKSEEAQEKIQSILIMVTGFMIISAVNNLDLFTFGALGADAEFAAIMEFISRWVGSIGALVMFIGGVMFGFALKDNNAATKVNSLKTLAAGTITASVALMLPMFV